MPPFCILFLFVIVLIINTYLASLRISFPFHSHSYRPSVHFLVHHFFLSNNLCPLSSSSSPCRLLKVKPEERLTIEGVLAHPWLNCTEALDNVLPSAQMMMDKVSGKLKVVPVLN